MTDSKHSFGRRQLLTGAVAAAAASGLAASAAARAASIRIGAVPGQQTGQQTAAAGPFTLEPLPYAESALDPLVSPLTVSFHYGKHHKGYVDNLNRLVAGTPLATKSLEEVVRATASDAAMRGTFNNAAQVWNHTFYWKSMSPSGGGKPSGEMLARIERAFGSFDAFAAEFARVSTTQFGAGWGWLVENTEGGLEVMATSNADLPLLTGKRALLTIDVWEHAYYLDFQNRRADYVRLWLERLANWEFASAAK